MTPVQTPFITILAPKTQLERVRVGVGIVILGGMAMQGKIKKNFQFEIAN